MKPRQNLWQKAYKSKLYVPGNYKRLTELVLAMNIFFAVTAVFQLENLKVFISWKVLSSVYLNNKLQVWLFVTNFWLSKRKT